MQAPNGRPGLVSRGQRLVVFVGVLATLAKQGTAAATDHSPIVQEVMHEPIPPDPAEDIAMHAALDGNLPAALQTSRGPVDAPDPHDIPSSADPSYAPNTDHDQFRPDRDTRRPQVSGYDDPFTPSTAPFKRLAAFDAVRDDYTLYVHDGRLVATITGAPPGADDEAFFADIVVDVGPEGHVRIPSVGPGAHIVRARLGVGAEDVAFRVLRDGADNWFLEGQPSRSTVRAGSVRARLVMEVAIARAAFGGQFADPSWADLPPVERLPNNVARDAALVTSALGVGRAMRPQRAIARLVNYFRGFTDSDVPLPVQTNVYLDLVHSKKGVCRHRAFAFLVTALSLGIPTRLVLNEAHAWVEVHDGVLWRRIDLGGAGDMIDSAKPRPDRLAHAPPVDAFPWPRGASRGDEMVAAARTHSEQAATTAGGTAASLSAGSQGNGAPSFAPGGSGPKASTSTPISAPAPPPESPADDRAPSAVTVEVTGADTRRGFPLQLHGTVHAGGEPCAHVAVDVSLRDPSTRAGINLGALATDDRGVFAGSIVVPSWVPLGNYDVVARTTGDTRCAATAPMR